MKHQIAQDRNFWTKSATISFSRKNVLCWNYMTTEFS